MREGALLTFLWASGVAALFPTPSSPAIPTNIDIATESTCSRSYTPIQGTGGWVAGGHFTYIGPTESTFGIRAWGAQFMYLRLNEQLPGFKTGLSYRMTFELKLAGTYGVLAFEPRLVRFKEGKSSVYMKDDIWPTNYTQDRPDDVIGGVELPFTGTDIGSGWTRYEQTWVSPVSFPDPTESLWIRFYLQDRPQQQTNFTFKEVCVERVAESRAPPPTLPSFSEKFTIEPAGPPPAAELTAQSGCPWTESGLVTWESVVGHT
eukprot:TRINITY_DN2683_c0_g1_i3.p1 TRINITY_DN2683_c0_g1~~TRINITY_DN2683_c0_g1_i3.p1  ORF type:complete len:272 (+),score=76.23 TRINITY_DN2683_c0_g1_i3:33-818(+)